MAQVFPFRAFRYNPAVAPYARVLTQPYDKISPEMQDRYYASDPHNLITVEKGRLQPGDSPQNNVYTRAAGALASWIEKQAVVEDRVPCFYAYTQEFSVPGTNERRTRRGFIGAGKLEDYTANVIFRHEHTHSGPKADRLELLRHLKMSTGQLFMLYADPKRRVDAVIAEAEESGAPVTEVADDYGVIHRLWIISDAGQIRTIQQAMSQEKLVIADGHHRYETALNYRNENRALAGRENPEAAYERAMMTFVNTSSEGLTILPTHRVAANVHDFSWTAVHRYLEPWFSTEAFSFENDAEKAAARSKFLERLRAVHPIRAIGAYPYSAAKKKSFYLLKLRDGADLHQLLPSASVLQRDLDVVLLHDGILEPALGITLQAVTKEAFLTYEREAGAALDAVDSGRAQISFLLNPVEVGKVMQVATAGEVMPQKSTDFFPKLLSGITMYRVED